MRRFSFCTIITPDYLPFALNLRDSIAAQGRAFALHVLASCRKRELPEGFGAKDSLKNVVVHTLDEICASGTGAALFKKYAKTNMDALRWSLKPVFLAQLLRARGTEKAVYIDCDIQFFGDFKFIFDELDKAAVLLTPHWLPYRKLRREGDSGFDNLLLSGVFNAGFAAASRKGLDALDWWASACLFKCDFDRNGGYFCDQTYLQVLHACFSGTKALLHKGCNVAYWNREECRRERLKDGSVAIDGRYPVVFAHFPVAFLDEFLEGGDKPMLPYLLRYVEGLRRNGLSDYAALFTKPGNVLRFVLEDLKRAKHAKLALAAAPGLLSDKGVMKALRNSKLKCVLKTEGSPSAKELRDSGAEAIVALGREVSGAAGLPVFNASLRKRSRNPFASTPPSPLMEKALAKLKKAGASRVVLYGAGDFTVKSLAAPQPSQGVSFLGILDDSQAKRGMLLCGLPILSKEDVEALKPDAILVSSDSVQGVLFGKARQNFPKTPVFSIAPLKKMSGRQG